MKTISLLLAAATGFVASPVDAADVTGSGHVASETRQVSGFHGVNLRGSGNVIVTQGDTEGLVIDAEDNLLPLIEASVSDGILRLGFKEHSGSIEAHKEVTYHLSVKTLDHLAVEGSGDIHAATLAADHASLSLPGSGGIVIDEFKADAVDAAINGSGEIKLGGATHRETVSINGSGNYVAKDFKADDATVTINGSGEADLRVDATLMATINGSGEIGYLGHPAVVKNVHGSGRVHPEGGKDED